MSMVSERDHEAVARRWEFGQVPTTGTAFIRVVFEILTGPDTGLRVAYTGYLTPNAIKNTADALKCMGWDGESLRTLRGIGTKRSVVSVRHTPARDGSTKVYPEVAFVRNVLTANVKNKLSKDGIDQLEALYQKTKAGDGGASDEPPPDTSAGDDEIPFR